MERAFLIGVDGVTEAWLVRHAQPDPDQRWADDPGLSPLGREQAARLARRTTAWSPSAVYSSPLRRARETGLALGGELRQDPRLEEAVVEVSDGRLAQVEPFPQVATRMAEAIRDAVEAHPGGRIVIVSHGLAILNYLVDVLGLEPGSLRFFPQHTSVSAVRLGEGRRVVASMGDVAHLEADHR